LKIDKCQALAGSRELILNVEFRKLIKKVLE
jgi:hypothetical protein